MPMLHTIQNSYEPMQPAAVTGEIGNEIPADGTQGVLDGTHPGFTYDWSIISPGNNVEYGYRLRPDQNGGVIRVEGYDVSDNAHFGFNLWGYATKGPAEHIAEISCAFGHVRIGDTSENLHADTMTVVSDTHIKSVAAFDSGSERVAKTFFDAAGYDVIYCEFEDLSSATSASICNGSVQAYIRGF